MLQLKNINHSFNYETENLLRVFFPEKSIALKEDIEESEPYFITEITENEILCSFFNSAENFSLKKAYTLSEALSDDTKEAFLERSLAKVMFELLTSATGYRPPWGILTGVRPAKLMGRLFSSMTDEQAQDYFKNELMVSEEKTLLAFCVAKKEADIIKNASEEKSFSLYVSVPFCPTRCSYCSFISHSNESAKKLMPSYTQKLCEEIRQTGFLAKNLGLKLESVYFGGGTPTALSAEQLKLVTDAVSESFDLSDIKEYTIEAGRPDSVTKEKFEVMKNCGCNRISINPQTFNDSVLKEIGRNHASQQTLEAFSLARKEGFDFINMDLIAGLPTDTVDSFNKTLDTVLSLEPENITVHTLALKRSSTIVTESKRTNSGEIAAEMLSLTNKRLREKGYIPYYMYRQSKSLGNLENVGWTKEGFEGLYNVYMMEECHTILAVGAGAVTKLKKFGGNEIERIFNYKYPYEYISGFDEILKRKNKITEFYTG
ncbi:MAG: coproporphyrinogen dehydrogenase HemZ [Acutalibacteraceae bacterium]